MLESDPKNAELQALRATYLARSGNVDEAVKYAKQLIGYDPKTDKFDVKKAACSARPSSLCHLGHDRSQQRKQAGVGRSHHGSGGRGQSQVGRSVRPARPVADCLGQSATAPVPMRKQAYKLKPDDTDVLLFMSDLRAEDKELRQGQRVSSTKPRSFIPDDVQLYQRAAAAGDEAAGRHERRDTKQHYDKAMAEIEEGMKKVSGSKAMQMLFFKANLQIPGERRERRARNRRRAAETAQACGRRSSTTSRRAFCWPKASGIAASEAFNKLRSKIGDFGRESGRWKSITASACATSAWAGPIWPRKQYELVLQQDPQNEPAKAGILRVKGMLGVASERQRRRRSAARINCRRLKKPKDQQDWTQSRRSVSQDRRKNATRRNDHQNLSSAAC